LLLSAQSAFNQRKSAVQINIGAEQPGQTHKPAPTNMCMFALLLPKS